jgi:hypothetical protein
MHEFLFVNSWLFYSVRICYIHSFLVLSYAPPLGLGVFNQPYLAAGLVVFTL